MARPAPASGGGNRGVGGESARRVVPLMAASSWQRRLNVRRCCLVGVERAARATELVRGTSRPFDPVLNLL